MSKRKKSRLGLFIILAGIIYLSCIMIDQQRIIYAKQEERKQIERKIEEEKRVNKSLKRQKEDINSDEFIERVARERLGFIKPGEKVFINVD
ncbi:cell division protein FtsB [Anaerobacterium chartisolvens]|uniref:Cell division protein FtsB n=1 Tax=Anaerobacterium chartisolvens TaxID=1297424 RepID=A0A369B8L1_9FIRM|nr:septum formation initiator family protein [Anaerobacterium chartisolvens]RCX17870.1 cell division protein FtsB [Anaerobacterium chartisolvens]